MAASPPTDQDSTVGTLRDFVESAAPPVIQPWSAVSLFSGAGLSDFGYRLAGFHFKGHVESDESRAVVGKPNFPSSTWLVNRLPRDRDAVLAGLRTALAGQRPALLTVTPPCQGMSSSNPSRGRRHSDKSAQQAERNRLILETIPFAQALQPRIIVAENVRPVITLRLEENGRLATVIEHLQRGLPDYEVFHGVIDVADYGIPQTRRRAVVVAVRTSEPWIEALRSKGLVPWPSRSHTEARSPHLHPWISISTWLEAMSYEPLDATSKSASRGTHALHRVPFYDDDRYLQISDIHAGSGHSAYQNDRCPDCGFEPVARGIANCSACGAVMRNRPYRVEDGQARLVRGFHSSYRRINPDRPAPTVTTNTSHLGSDIKIHPTQNRVMSTLECADLQTVPRSFDWSGALDNRRHYLIRNVIGEAFPTYFTYLHGNLLARLLNGEEVADSELSATPRSTVAPRATSVPPGLIEAA
jgi:DNA (cytosine-5)-methyltransferase 1